MPGQIALYIAFFSALGAGVLFWLTPLTKKKDNRSRAAIQLYYLHTAAVVAASAFLLYALLTHQFQYDYVYANTDLSLSPIYLFSAFWAGQEGSYLFWALCGAVAGLFLLKKEQNLRHLVMPVIMTGQAFLLLFLVLDSPFQLLDWIPADGAGLNPLLMDPWMVIHPPIVFVGYALLIIPFAYAVAALYVKDYHRGFMPALPWAVCGWLFLGAGIFIGGVWAYRVLGWGGYWGWDPVENASLIPWLAGTALVHGMLLQLQKRVFLRANLFLGITTYLLVIFATFLTRSGAMAEYSVHAFNETALTYFLAAFLILFALAGYILLALRFRAIGEQADVPFSPLNRPGTFGLTMAALCASALLVLLGTLSPLITGLFGTPASVDEAFYFRTNGPLALVVLVLLGLCPFARWQQEERRALLLSLGVPLAAAAVAVAAALFAGVMSLFDLLFIGAGAFALASNLIVLFRVFLSRGFKYSGGYLAHVGLALMFVAILASTNYTRSSMIHLTPEQPVQTLGYTFTYSGHTPGEKYILNIAVTAGEKTVMAQPKMYMAGESLMREPAILRNLWRDLYISPVELTIDDHNHQVVLAKGESFDYEGYMIRFNEFSFPQPHGSGAESMEIGAVLEVRSGDAVEIIMPVLKVDGANQEHLPALLPGSDIEIFLVGVDATRGLAGLSIGEDSHPGKEVLAVELKHKPFIVVLGLGTTLLLGGTLIAVWRRFTTRSP